nr:DUF4328 domain-containing protein [candidate division Zixibacteria bacterium]
MSQLGMNYNTQEYHYTQDPTLLTKFLKAILWISLGISILSQISDFMQMNLLNSGTISMSEAEANDNRQRIIGILHSVAFIGTGIAFLKWIYRANSNCHGFGAQGIKFIPARSIGYYFMPIINLYRPSGNSVTHRCQQVMLCDMKNNIEMDGQYGEMLDNLRRS